MNRPSRHPSVIATRAVPRLMPPRSVLPSAITPTSGIPDRIRSIRLTTPSPAGNGPASLAFGSSCARLNYGRFSLNGSLIIRSIDMPEPSVRDRDGLLRRADHAISQAAMDGTSARPLPIARHGCAPAPGNWENEPTYRNGRRAPRNVSDENEASAAAPSPETVKTNPR
jgi:hypothetical protein